MIEQWFVKDCGVATAAKNGTWTLPIRMNDVKYLTSIDGTAYADSSAYAIWTQDKTVSSLTYTWTYCYGDLRVYIKQ